MSFDINKKIIDEIVNKGKEIFLIDSSAFCRYEEIDGLSNFSFLDYIKNHSIFHFLMSNEVLTEISNGPRNLNFAFFNENIINVEGGFASDYKENRFVIEQDGKLQYVVLNKISGQDYNQILLAQNHPELHIVTNDEKFLKSATSLLGKDRVFTPFSFLEKVLKQESHNIELKKYKNASLELFKLKKYNYKKLTN